MTDFVEFDPPGAYRLTHDRLPATSWFALSTKSVDDFIDAGYATGSTNPPRSLALGINEITGKGYGRQSQSTPAGSGESTTYSQLTWDTGTATNWDSPKTLVLCTTADNRGRALCAWNLTPGGAATDLSTAHATVQITPVVAPPSSGGSGSSVAGYPPAAGNNGFAQGSIAAGGAIAVSGSYPGGFAQGLAGGASSAITSSGRGSFAQGYAVGGGAITSSRFGSFAQGDANGAGSTISSTGWGSFAQGYAVGGGAITSSNSGSFAQGYALTGGAITSSWNGSFAQGYAATGETIAATASNAVQFGPGTNSQADSLQVGNGGIRLLGKAAAQPQTTFQNGDIWVADDGHVKVRSNGATVSL